MVFRFGMTLLVASAAGLYFPLNRKLTGGFNLSTRLDNWIPLWAVWVIPYLLCLPIWAGGLMWAAWKMDEELFRSFVSACLFVLLSAALFYYFFPTYVKRPILTKGNWTIRVLQMVYQNDGDYNAFPSGHVYQTSLICLFYNHLYPNYQWLWIGFVVIVILSTLFTRQHNLIDPLGGLAIAWLGYRFGLYLYS
ncbi:MAG: phosphatase PAP2 family protein [Anaerolineales bacterium]|nr:phosphatase PAP2 family protein [Anaerolineales bacterium]